jgi:hypothetical protein
MEYSSAGDGDERLKRYIRLPAVAFEAVAATTNFDEDGYSLSRDVLLSMARFFPGSPILLNFDPDVTAGRVKKAWVVQDRLFIEGEIAFYLTPAAAGLYLATGGVMLKTLKLVRNTEQKIVKKMEKFVISLVPGNKDSSVPSLVFKPARCAVLN